MQHVDALSRAPHKDCDSQDTVEEILCSDLDVCTVLTIEDKVMMAQRSDSEVNEIVNMMNKQDEERTKYESDKTKNYIIKNGLLYRCYKDKLLFRMPRSMRKSTRFEWSPVCGQNHKSYTSRLLDPGDETVSETTYTHVLGVSNDKDTKRKTTWTAAPNANRQKTI